ncbi:MAG: hypothetical protein ABII12_06585 [Planctomycetota bacterium]
MSVASVALCLVVFGQQPQVTSDEAARLAKNQGLIEELETLKAAIGAVRAETHAAAALRSRESEEARRLVKKIESAWNKMPGLAEDRIRKWHRHAAPMPMGWSYVLARGYCNAHHYMVEEWLLRELELCIELGEDPVDAKMKAALEDYCLWARVRASRDLLQWERWHLEVVRNYASEESAEEKEKEKEDKKAAREVNREWAKFANEQMAETMVRWVNAETRVRKGALAGRWNVPNPPSRIDFERAGYYDRECYETLSRIISGWWVWREEHIKAVKRMPNLKLFGRHARDAKEKARKIRRERKAAEKKKRKKAGGVE